MSSNPPYRTLKGNRNWFDIAGLVISCVDSVQLRFFWGGAEVLTPSKPPAPYEQFSPLPIPCFKMFLERSLNDPPPPHFKHLSLLPPPHPPPLPNPIKILIIHTWPSSTVFYFIGRSENWMIVQEKCAKILNLSSKTTY